MVVSRSVYGPVDAPAKSKSPSTNRRARIAMISSDYQICKERQGESDRDSPRFCQVTEGCPCCSGRLDLEEVCLRMVVAFSLQRLARQPTCHLHPPPVLLHQ